MWIMVIFLNGKAKAKSADQTALFDSKTTALCAQGMRTSDLQVASTSSVQFAVS